MPGAPKHKKAAEQSFHDVLGDGGATPEMIMIAVMRGETDIAATPGAKKVKLTKQMIEAAQTMLPFRLPRLNSVDAVQRNVSMTHEEWIASMDGGEADGE